MRDRVDPYSDGGVLLNLSLGNSIVLIIGARWVLLLDNLRGHLLVTLLGGLVFRDSRGGAWSFALIRYLRFQASDAMLEGTHSATWIEWASYF